MLEFDVQHRLDGLEVSVELSVASGSCLALVGPSGAGKTTVLRAIAGLRRPQRGRVRLGDETWLDTNAGVDLPAQARRCGFVFQSYALFGHLRAWQNVAYPIRGVARDERRRRAEELLGRFGMRGRAEARPQELSGGERQRVALARALALEPRALLLDEPLSALDARTRAHAQRELASLLSETSAPAILVTHDFEQAALLADEAAIVEDGRVVQRDDPGALAAAPANAFVADFTGASVLLGAARIGDDGLATVALKGGGLVRSTDRESGPVAATVFPWEVSLVPRDEVPAGSALNNLAAEVVSMTTIGNRVRVGLALPQPLSAEITADSAQRLGLARGSSVVAVWKATATRLVPR